MVAEPATPGHGRQGGYLSKRCFTYSEYENMPRTFSQDLKLELSQFTQSIMESGNVFEDAIGEKLALLAGEHVAIIVEQRDENGDRTPEGKRAKEEETFAHYMNPDIRAVFNARIGSRFEELLSEKLGTSVEDRDRISEPDVIEFGDMMPNGVRAMRFVDVKWHKVTSGESLPKSFRVSTLAAPYLDAAFEKSFSGSLHIEDWMQLSHYYRHGESLGVVDGDSSLWGAVIGKEELLVWGRLDTATFQRFDRGRQERRRMSALEYYDREFGYGLAVVDNARARDNDPAVPRLQQPEWKTECSDCPWRDVCLAELKAHQGSGHITLLPGVTPDRARQFYDLGVTSIAELASLDVDKESLPGLWTDAQQKFAAKAVIQARVQLTGNAARRADALGVEIPSADIEIDFDFEATTGDGGIVYMCGARRRDRVSAADGTVSYDVQMRWFDEYSDEPQAERNVFAQRWAYISDVLLEASASGKSVRLYHYSRFEKVTDLRLAKEHAGSAGIPTEEQVRKLYSSGVVVDLYEMLETMFVWPTMSHSIKKLAQFTGFSWRGDKIGGDLSMVWYRDIVQATDDTVRSESLHRLREYNEDDVAAQAHLRDWVATKLATTGFAVAEQLPAPRASNTPSLAA